MYVPVKANKKSHKVKNNMTITGNDYLNPVFTNTFEVVLKYVLIKTIYKLQNGAAVCNLVDLWGSTLICQNDTVSFQKVTDLQLNELYKCINKMEVCPPDLPVSCYHRWD